MLTESTMRMTLAMVGAAGLLAAQTFGTKQVAIVDPVLQMKAWTLTAPANFEGSGTMLPGSSCSSATSPIYRVATADGRTGAYFLPRMDWTGSRAGKGDCLPFQGVMSAKDFLVYFIRLRKLGFVSEEPVPELAEFRRSMEQQAEQARSRGMDLQMTADMARFLVRYSVNEQPTEEWVTATTTCSGMVVTGMGRTLNCSAFVTRWFAPLGKLQAAIPQFKMLKMTVNQEWMNAWTAAMVQHTTALYGEQTKNMLAQGQLAHDQLMRQHQQFQRSMEQGREIRNDRFVEGQYNKTKQKEDFVDYISDCQRLSSGSTRVSIGNCPNRETGGY